MKVIRLVHWNEEEAKEKAVRIRTMGYSVNPEVPTGPSFLRELKANPPDAVVIDLARLPSHGRDMALLLRKTKATRHVPLLFAGGDEGKIVAIRKILPDALFYNWDEIEDGLAAAVRLPLRDPVVPSSVFEGYSGKALPDKLGIKPDSTLTLINAPTDFDKTLGPLPEGVCRNEELGPATDLTICFVRSVQDLLNGVRQIASLELATPVWIAWPKKRAGRITQVTQREVRKQGLDAGLVDFKICSIDEVWSGLLFRKRRK